VATTLYRFTDAFIPAPQFFAGGTTTNLVPDVFPIAIDGRPFLIDQQAGTFTRGFEPRVRDSVDQSTSPGEAAINPQGLWRRGETSWHYGAGQKYADTAEAQDYRFFSSKGVNPWTKGQLTLLNKTKVSLASAATTAHSVVQDGRIYFSLGADVKFTTDPYESSPTWTDCTGEPGGICAAMATDGNDVYLAFPNDGVRRIDTSAAPGTISGTRFVTGTNSYYMLGFAKGYMFAAHDQNLRQIAGAGSSTDRILIDDPDFRWVGVATGQNAVYAAGYAGKKSLIYKITIKADGTLDTGVVALELPTGEVVTAISGYLGFILIGTDKGVRFASTDSNSNLVAGQIIPTSGAVNKFTSEGRFSYFTWTNYDGVSGGLGRLDLGTLTSANTPAFATDLMYDSTNTVHGLVTFNNKRCFWISGVGIIAEDSANLVESAEIVTGTYRWGIPDRKFVAKFDIRTTPLYGTITPSISLDSGDYTDMSPHNLALGTESVATGPQSKFIEAKFKLTLNRGSATTAPTLTRWMARAYASPARSQVFRVPILMHHRLHVRDTDYYFDVESELRALRDLVTNPRVVNYQENTETFSVVLEDLQFEVADGYQSNWDLEGTCTVTMRSVQD
jgi:hypothetical protein